MSKRQITIESDFSAVRNVSDLLSSYCVDYHISPKMSGYLELMLVEALNNVIEHAYEGKSGHKIHIELVDSPQHTTIHIKDYGISASDFLQNNEITFPTENLLPEGGWGLPLIQVLADTINYQPSKDNNLLILIKNKH